MAKSPIVNAFRFVLTLPLLVLAAGCSGPDPMSWTPSPTQAKLVELTTQRLELAREVAWYKYREGLPVLDKKREAESLKNLVAQGKALGVPERTTRRYFLAQMTASRMFQSDLISGWQRGSPLPTLPPRNLSSGIRPEIDRLNSEILVQLATAGSSARDPRLAARTERYLRTRNIPEIVIWKTVSPLR